MKTLLQLLEIKGNHSTVYHPQSDGQTERTNATLEQYLRVFCNYQQDDWWKLLLLAECAYNNAQSASTKVSPFFANYGYHPRSNTKVTITNTSSTNPTAEAYAENLKQIHSRLTEDLKAAQEAQKRYYNRHAKQPPRFKVGDKVWLLRKNITTTRPVTIQTI